MVKVCRQLGVIPDSSPTVIEKNYCLYIYSVQKMILKFDFEIVVVDLMSHYWMWSKLNCFITGVVNWVMAKNRGNSTRFSIKCLSV